MKNNIILYNTEDGKAKIELHVENETVWINQLELAELFQTSKQNISKHIKVILEDGELDEESTVNYKLTVQNEGGRNISRNIAYYSLDMILAIGYRVRSPRGIQFRNYASTILKEYLIKGFAIDDNRLKNLGVSSYFKELLDRIRDIRSSEKVFYRQVLDLFATSIDYCSHSDDAKLFFATIQNKMHFAIHHHTTSELIYERVDSAKEFMGLTVFQGELPTLKEAKTAKNYLSEKELKSLNTLVSGFLEFAERQAQKQIAMTMNDWLQYTDRVLSITGEELLVGNGSISKEQANKKVQTEYRRYQQNTLTQVEKDYLNEIKAIEKKAKEGGKNE
ncbi:RhuM family protein [Dialister pneumosintes]|uniref:Cell filamentation protein Fic n=1 Tax=Dialister pneumosintes TaxID=39950 RepID=A0ABX9MBG5_9FIRM|nr:RhuM family protein [Dialister pneumosintes]RID94929.1 cell filamentation protein Fic [Dialister pneumosintes]